MKGSIFCIFVLTFFLSVIPAAQAASLPVASFTSATSPSGTFSLPMTFKDTSTNAPTSWVWTCKNLTPGNNTEIVFSTAQKPTFTFGVGTWSIKLKASNAAGSSSTSGTYLVHVRTINDLQIFPKDHIWNVPIDTLPVNPRSADYIKTMDGYVIPHFGQKVRILPNVIDNLDGATNVTFKFRYPSISDNVPYPIPDDPFLENADRGEVDTCSGDCHMIIVDRSSKYLYELFGVGRDADGTWTAGSGAVYNLSSYTLRPPGWASADAAGLAMLPGYLRYDEVAAGKITHPTRFSTALTQNQYVWPAISGGSYANTAYPPMGQRFRLKSSFDTSGYPYQARIILESWKKYGLILADNAIPGQYWDVFGFGDARWDPTALDALQDVKGSDFEAVDVSSLIIDENSGKARISPVITPKPTPKPTPTVNEQMKIGVHKEGIWYLDSNGDGAFTGIDKTFSFGTTGGIPVVGDWNGDGKSERGIYKDAVWYIDYSGSGVIDTNTRYYQFGAADWTPVTGDWNGDKKDEIGVYQNGNWYLDYNGNGVWDTGDKNYKFGTTGWTPIVGDWNGNKKIEIGIYKDGNWYLDYNGDGLFTGNDKYIPYGTTGWTQIVGDWNGDGKSEIGIYKDAVWYLDYGGSGVIDKNTRYYRFGTAGWTPVTGDWNGDKKDNIAIYKDGMWYLDYNGDGAFGNGDKVYSFGQTEWTAVVGKWS